jgi:hypothetical protein
MITPHTQSFGTWIGFPFGSLGYQLWVSCMSPERNPYRAISASVPVGIANTDVPASTGGTIDIIERMPEGAVRTRPENAYGLLVIMSNPILCDRMYILADQPRRVNDLPAPMRDVSRDSFRTGLILLPL